MEQGQRYGRLVAIEFADNINHKTRWLFQCDCGNKRIARIGHVRTGATQSCGCFRNEQTRQANTTHGGASSAEYGVWLGIIARCEDPDNKHYGARGITICKQWRHDFGAFLTDMGPRPSTKHSIDRYPDKDGNYEPGNCRWVTQIEQMRNISTNRIVEFQWREMTLAEAVERSGLSYDLVWSRLKLGWSEKCALTTPKRKWTSRRR